MTTILRLQQLAKLLDITRLQDNETAQTFAHWLQTVPDIRAAAYCVYPQFLAALQQWPKRNNSMALATVVNFPAGDLAVDQVCEQILQAKLQGATEIDCVLPYKALLRGEHGSVKNFLYDVRQASSQQCLKIIIESGELVTAQQVAMATELAIESGADFVKTSTGKVPVGVTEEAARIMLTVIAAADRPVGFKASGGVRHIEQALSLIQLFEDITGKIATSQHMRIGASTLADEVAKQISQAN
ncbi:MAG: deoxyribose-phosphate aldolase [Gammaproteobacteria bacterium]|nr:deoxyribose-phosphate aldolase [Gammaproteobacteria bacterium]MBU1553652.1 deoxyribose-phosphate aldolase [Gammaproteobacteria bacterium]MBU2070157.1 deoxyribose-phosphate aldolase [Gammaproteobacteria bacterium]MBU2183592.1 deoxyribose-phosphate aldolase [Gammaproteobacteria bacterium]MBU2204743.1 deoxyribose-phosphate aldolase [Gammaproteobacteria bacterium]